MRQPFRNQGISANIVRKIVFFATFFVFTAVVSSSWTIASDHDPQRDLTVQQIAVFGIKAPKPTNGLNVVAWVDHADNTYAVGEAVRLFVRTNKDAYLTVINVGPSGNTTVLFPNSFQKDSKVTANKVVEIPAPNSGSHITVGGPAGRELIKVIATTKPTSFFNDVPAIAVGAFSELKQETVSVSRDLQVTLDTQQSNEWDEYNKIITSIASRATAVLPLQILGTQWPLQAPTLQIATDKSHYRIGDAITIYLRAQVPCYLTLVNIGSSGQTRVLLPNAMFPQNLIQAGQTVVFPTTGSNLRLTPVGPAGVETLTAICSADNQPVVVGDLAYGRDGFAALEGAQNNAATRDLAVVATNPARRASHATTGFIVTQ